MPLRANVQHGSAQVLIHADIPLRFLGKNAHERYRSTWRPVPKLPFPE